ncbi:MAG: DUF1579 domain-containing protein [Planctomycetes bacterium]|nr:DUF1579 domain-containing protein [Planctomycetota bacterium]
MSLFTQCSAVIATCAFLALPLAAADDAKTMPPGMDPAAMEMMKPGPEHQMLAKRAGTWDVACKMWMMPDAPAQESKGTAKTTVILDGRYIQDDFTGEFMGQPFKGMGLTGYDRQEKKYYSTWVDSMSTSMMQMTGTSEDNGKTVTTTGECMCPMAKEKIAFRQVEKHTSDDAFTVEMYKTVNGKESKCMELAYTRKK